MAVGNESSELSRYVILLCWTGSGIVFLEWMFRVDFLAAWRLADTNDWHGLGHRGLKLGGAIGQEKICNYLKSENFSKSFLSHIGKNKIKF